MKKFELYGIKPPGKVDIQGIGTVNLSHIDDALAEKLFLAGVPFIRPLPKYREKLTGEKPLAPRKLSKDKQPPGKPSSRVSS